MYSWCTQCSFYTITNDIIIKHWYKDGLYKYIIIFSLMSTFNNNITPKQITWVFQITIKRES